MSIQLIINKKVNNEKLEKNEIEYFVQNYTNGNISDDEAAGLIRAIYKNGMDIEETTNLTLAMANSGDILDLSSFGKTVVDKHSTGGVGDKITIVLAPIIASLGIPVAKMSGRGLGITGGTKDKLESIPGYRTEIEIDEFIKNVEEIGISLIGQTGNLAPADKKIYALRDEIGCTDNIPLIASSIMSKKIASGADKIIIELTYGSGAFMKSKEEALELADIMMKIGEIANKETKCVLTEMNQPIGYAIGNNLEIIEAINCLKGNIPSDVKETILELGSQMIKMAGICDDLEENKKKILENIENGKAYEKFLELVKRQGGDISYIEDTNKFEKSKYIENIKSEKDFVVTSLDAKEIGEICKDLGAGREKKEDNIDFTVGIVLNKKVGDSVKKDETLCFIHANNEKKLNDAIEKIKKVYK